MLVLNAVTKSIVAALDAAPAINPDFTVAFGDNTGTVFTEGANDGALNGTSSVTVVAAPAASTRRIIKSITIENKNTAAVTVTLSYNNNGTLRTIVKVTLQVGDTWTTNGTFDTNGSIKQTLGAVNLATVTGILPVTNGGTGVTTATGSGSVVLSTSPTFTTPNLGTPSAATLTNATGLPIVAGTTGTLTVLRGGTGVTTSTGTGSVVLGTSPTFTTQISVPAIVKTGTNGVGNIGQSGNAFNTVFAKATSAQYADLAELYTADADYAPGTVVCFGGTAEVTECDIDSSPTIAGIISTAPAYTMNSTLVSEHTAVVALVGRVPCQVQGPVRRGQMMVAAGQGRARAEPHPEIGTVIGKALEDFNGDIGVVEVVVGRI
jgi:hypothetical protein